MNHTRILLMLLFAVVLGTAAVAFSFAREPLATVANNTKPATSAAPASANGDSSSEQMPQDNNVATSQELEVEVLTLKADGFEPRVITRPAGAFILAFHNQSGVAELTFRLATAQRNQVFEARLNRRTYHRQVDLPTGEYVLTETNHPTWVCQLTISN